LSGADIVGVAVARNESTHYKVYWAMVIGRRDAKRKPGTVSAAASRRGVEAAPDAPAGDSSVSEWVNRTITSIKNLLP
jgi:hypothetical protein